MKLNISKDGGVIGLDSKDSDLAGEEERSRLADEVVQDLNGSQPKSAALLESILITACANTDHPRDAVIRLIEATIVLTVGQTREGVSATTKSVLLEMFEDIYRHVTEQRNATERCQQTVNDSRARGLAMRNGD